MSSWRWLPLSSIDVIRRQRRMRFTSWRILGSRSRRMYSMVSDNLGSCAGLFLVNQYTFILLADVLTCFINICGRLDRAIKWKITLIVLEPGDSATWFCSFWHWYEIVLPVVRATVPKLLLDDVFEQKNEIANSVKEELEKVRGWKESSQYSPSENATIL